MPSQRFMLLKYKIQPFSWCLPAHHAQVTTRRAAMMVHADTDELTMKLHKTRNRLVLECSRSPISTSASTTSGGPKPSQIGAGTSTRRPPEEEEMLTIARASICLVNTELACLSLWDKCQHDKQSCSGVSCHVSDTAE